jgi:PAS domain S-box-containing protein
MTEIPTLDSSLLQPEELLEQVKQLQREKQQVELEISELQTKLLQSQRSEELLSSICNGVDTPVIAITRDRKILHINAAGAALFGKKPEQLMGTICQTLFNTNACPGGNCATMRAMKENRVITEETIAHIAGKDIPIRYTATPLVDADGQIIGAVEFILDISHEKKSEAESLKAKNMIQAVLDGVASPVIAIDRKRIITLINKAGASLFGKNANDLVGSTCHSLFRTDDCDGGACATMRSMQEQRVVSAETVAHFGGKNIPILYTATPLYDDTGAVIGAVEFVLDQTAQKAAIQDIIDLTTAAAAGELNKRVDASRYTGDFKTIIEGINGTLEALVTPLHEAMRVCQDYGELRFDARFNPAIPVRGEFALLKKALNDTGQSVAETVHLLQNISAELAANTEEANASTEEITSGSAQIASIAQSVSNNSEQSATGIRQVLQAMDDLTRAVADVSMKAGNVSGIAGNANEISIAGSELAKKANSGMKDILQNTQDVNQIVNEIQGQMDQIGKIVTLITDIASQTNLLALNAAIEAARAGDAGRGFAVVAAEVKSLAQESRKSAENIADMIQNLQHQSLQAAEAMKTSTTIVQEGGGAVGQMLASFENIVSMIDTIHRNVEEVASSSEEQAASVEEITASIHELNDLIQSSAKEAVNTAAATEQEAAAIDQIGKVLNQISIIADQVNREMGRFQV